MRRAGTGGERVEAVELRLGITRAVVRAGVGEAVGGQHAIEARAAHPVVEVPVFLRVVDELDARARGDEILLRRLRDVAAVVEPVSPVRHVGRELLLNLARHQVAALEFALLVALQRACVPDEPAGHNQVLRRTVAGLFVRRVPERLAGLGVHAALRAVAAGVEHRIAGEHDARRVVELEDRALRGLLAGPTLRARRRVKRDEAVAVVIHDLLAVAGERDGRDFLVRLAPENFPGLRVNRHQVARLLVPVVFVHHAALVALLLHGKLFQRPRTRVHQRVEDAVGDDEFLRAFRAFEHPDGLARRTVEAGDRGLDAERDEDALALRDQPARELRGAGLQRPEMRVPRRDGLLPEDGAVERVARDELPLGRQQDGDARAFIHDVKEPARRRDLRAEARHAVVMPRPARAAHPLQPLRRADDAVLRGRVAFRVVEVMRPLVEAGVLGLHGLLPLATLLHHRDAVGHQRAHDLDHRHAAGLLGDEEVHRVVHVGEQRAVELVDADRAVAASGGDGVARGGDFRRVWVEALHLVTVIRPQCGGELAIPHPEVDDDAALDAGGGEDLPRVIGGGGGERNRSEVQQQRNGDRGEEGVPSRARLSPARRRTMRPSQRHGEDTAPYQRGGQRGDGLEETQGVHG